MAFEFSDVADDNFHANLSTSINLKHLKCIFEIGDCARLFICALWSPAGGGGELASWVSYVVSAVSLSLFHWYPGSGVVLDCIDS